MREQIRRHRAWLPQRCDRSGGKSPSRHRGVSDGRAFAFRSAVDLFLRRGCGEHGEDLGASLPAPL